jgi:RNA polymerase sigma factor (sigma-70 family)
MWSGLPLSEKPRLIENPSHQNSGQESCAPALESLSVKTTILNPLLDLRRQFLRFLKRRISDQGVAEDILQTAYVRALEAGGQLRDQESSVAWFYRILRNAVIDYYRRRAVEGAALDRWARNLGDETVPEPDLEPDPCPCIAAALAVMTPAYADLLRAVDLGETRLAAYAKGKGITAGNAAVRAHRARAALRRRLVRCCGTCAEQGCVECTCGVRPAASNPS